MSWEIWKGFIIGNMWIIFWVLFIFIGIVLYHKIRFKDAKAYLKSVGKSFVAVPVVLWKILVAIFNPYKVG